MPCRVRTRVLLREQESCKRLKFTDEINGGNTMAARILVVNDTQEILDLFQTILEDEGYKVVLSSFPFQHIKEVEEIKPDLIILDFLFGDKQLGWQMLQILKMQKSTASIPIIA